MLDYSVSDGLCVLRLNAPPLNTISPALLDDLRAAIRRAGEDPAARGIIITGSPTHFSAGADLGIFRELKTPEDAIRTSRVFQEAFQEVEDCPKPVAAAVAGNVPGSALELSLACHYRVCSRETRFSMPEVTFGINPGGGGTQRLPRLIGPGGALKMLLTAEPVDAEGALALGLVDAVCQGGRLVERAGDLLREFPAPRRTREMAGRVKDPAAREEAFQKAREILARTRPEILGPRTILEAVRAGLEDSHEAGLRSEREGFAECMKTPAARNRIYLFFATRETGKPSGPAGIEAGRIERAAVIGMGSMGTGIAQALISRGISTVVLDGDASALARGMGTIRKSLQKRVDTGKLSPAGMAGMLGQISTTERWEEIAGADLVIEAVFEDAAVKRSVLENIENTCPPETIIASNTSTISLEDLAGGMQRPGRLVGMHFFNPAHRMPLVEIIRRAGTPDRVIATAMAFARYLRKTPVLVNNREGFLVNRIFIPYLKEALWLLQEGAGAEEIDAALVEFGFPMGPIQLMDMAGLDILVLTDAVLAGAFPRHGPLPAVARRLVEMGHLGQKTGSGVYRYEKGDRTPRQSETTERLLEEIRRDEGGGQSAPGGENITRRLVLRLVNEAFYVLEEGIARGEGDIDVALVLATGFPDFRGGVLRHARDLGLDRVLAELEKLTLEHGQRYRPCKSLRDMEGV